MKRVLLIVSLGVIACGRSDKAAAPKDREPVATLLAHLPASTDAVVAGSVSDLARWPLWRRAVAVIAHEAPGIAERIVSQCKLDPWTLLSSAALAFTTDFDSTVLAAETSVGRAELHKCATAVGSEVALQIEDGPLTRYSHSGASEVAAWTSERVFLAIPQRMDETAALNEIMPERAVPAALQPLLQRVDRSATVWGVALTTGDGDVADFVSVIPLSKKPIGVHAAVHRTDRLRAKVALVFDDAAGASEAVAVFGKLLANPPPWLATWRDAIRVAAHDDEAQITLELDAARAKQLDDTIIALLPAPTAPPPPKPGSNVMPPPAAGSNIPPP